MKRALMVATVASTIGQFNMANIEILRNLGYEVSIACDFTDRSVWTTERVWQFVKLLKEQEIAYYQINFSRNPVNMQNLNAYKQLMKVIKEKNIDLIHCHTPVAGVLSRIAAKKTNTKVIYTAHGFHFFKGAPLKNWIIFYPIEKWLSKYTDVLITINKEDYKRAKAKFHAENIKYIPGVGIDLEKFNNAAYDMPINERNELRKQLNVPNDAFMLLSVGELNQNKNHQIVIKALADIKDKNIHYYIAGIGPEQKYLLELAGSLGIKERVHILGYRSDVPTLLQIADAFCFPSKREGLPVALMEALASGLPVMCSYIRGNVDLVDHEGGEKFRPNDVNDVKEKILKICMLPKEKRRCKGEYNREKIKKFDSCYVKNRMKKIYKNMK